MENQDTTSNEPKNDIYELLSKLVTSVDEYNENALSLSLDIEDLQNIKENKFLDYEFNFNNYIDYIISYLQCIEKFVLPYNKFPKKEYKVYQYCKILLRNRAC